MARGSTHPLRRRIGAASVVAGLLCSFVAIVAPPAGAGSHAFGPYVIDGVLDTHASIQHFPDKASGAGDDAFAGGVKEDDECPALSNTGTVVQNNNDLTDFYLGHETSGGDSYLYLGFRRAFHESVSTANYLLSFELNQSETSCGPGSPFVVRTPGDLLIGFEGHNPNQIQISEWLASDTWSEPQTITGSTKVRGALSTDHLFGEAVVNLHEAGIFSDDECTSFANALAKTRSSSSGGQSQIKDFIVPTEGVYVSNCGRLVVEKVTDGDVEGDETFSFSVECDDDDPIEFDLGDGEAWPADVDGADADDNLFFYDTECTVTEDTSGLDDGTWTTTYVVTLPGEDPTDPEEGDTVEGLVIEEGTIVVTFTNSRDVPPAGALVVTKTVSDGQGTGTQVFDFEIVCGEETLDEFTLGHEQAWPDDVQGAADNELAPGTVCTVTETAVTGWTTTHRVDGGAVQTGGTTGELTIESDETTTVEFTNTRPAITTVVTEPTPTTTVAPTTTTTVAPTTTTTTEAPQVEPVVVEPTTTTVAPTTTTVAPTTTTETVLGVVQERVLPRTGNETQVLMLVAGILLVLGGLALSFEQPLADRRRS
jgi:LPXTG-motif cell wall-anchored protein